MDDFAVRHLNAWLAAFANDERIESEAFERMSRIVNDDPEWLDRGWPSVWRAAECDELFSVMETG